jgi:dihydrofolate reductase
MRKVVVSEFLSVDGVMEAHDRWSGLSWHDDMEKYKYDELLASDALLLGRVTYEIFAAAWPSLSEGDAPAAGSPEAGDRLIADRMNGLPKYVVYTTLKNADWQNSTIISADVLAEVAKLKEGTGGDILIYGSADLINSLIPHGLIDEYRLMIQPVVAGSGKRLFDDGLANIPLKLVDTTTFPTGVIVLTYHPADT